MQHLNLQFQPPSIYSHWIGNSLINEKLPQNQNYNEHLNKTVPTEFSRTLPSRNSLGCYPEWFVGSMTSDNHCVLDGSARITRDEIEFPAWSKRPTSKLGIYSKAGIATDTKPCAQVGK